MRGGVLEDVFHLGLDTVVYRSIGRLGAGRSEHIYYFVL